MPTIGKIRQGLLDVNSVTTASISAGAITTDKIADNSITINKLITSSPQKTVITGNGSTDTFAVDGIGINDSPTSLTVYLDGVMQEPQIDYTISGGNITFTTPPSNGARVIVIAPYAPANLVSNYAYPIDGSVTTIKLANNAVTTGKIADDAITSEKLAQNIIIDGDLTVFGNLTALGTSTQINTNVSTTSALSVINVGTGPALVVRQTGPEPIAEFFDNESGPALWLANNGLVGVGTNEPISKLTVAGDVSATNGYFQNSIRIDAKSNVNATLSAVTVFGVVSAQTLTTTNYALLVQINNQQFGVPLFNIS